MTRTQALPDGVTPLTQHVSVPDVLARRMGQIGLVDPDDGARLQPLLKPGQRLVGARGRSVALGRVSRLGRGCALAAALRLQQLNRLEELKQRLERADARADGARAGA